MRVKGVTRCPNVVLHTWLKSEVDALLATLPEPAPIPRQDPSDHRAQWTRWQEGLTIKINLPAVLPLLRLLLVWDNLTGHHTPELVLWLFARGAWTCAVRMSSVSHRSATTTIPLRLPRRCNKVATSRCGNGKILRPCSPNTMYRVFVSYSDFSFHSSQEAHLCGVHLPPSAPNFAPYEHRTTWYVVVCSLDEIG